jgi:peptidoglycan/LPS O-acetylase OafA/YrhL
MGIRKNLPQHEHHHPALSLRCYCILQKKTCEAALDGIRGLAVLLVLMFHFVYTCPDVAIQAASGELLRRLSYVGWTGVDLFFVLSGFLITRILISSKGSGSYFVNFYGRRVLRIFPLYYLTLMSVFIIVPKLRLFFFNSATPMSRDHWYFWTYTVNLAHLFRDNLNEGQLGHFWSLCVEEHFYIFWPWVVWKCDRERLRIVCFGLVLMAIASRIGLQLAEVSSTPIFYFTLCRLDSLAMGAWVATYATNSMGEAQALPISWRSRAIKVAVSAVVCLIPVVVLDKGSLRGGIWSQRFGLTLIGIIYTCGIVRSLTIPVNTVFNRILMTNTLRSFGKYSYGIYVLHPLVQSFLMSKLVKAVSFVSSLFGPFANYFGVVAIFAALTTSSFIAAFVVYNTVEKRFLNLKRFFYDGRSA